MALSVIGAGFGRTGTESMKLALEALGMGPCHHMKEVLPNPDQIALWRALAGGGVVDWDKAFAGYNSTVDWPGAYYLRELSAYYPKAKIVLTLRSAESWYASMEKTILKVLKTSTEPTSLGLRLIGHGVFDDRLDDRDHLIAKFEKNTADVQAAFDGERLLTYNLGDGWEPLCRFLGKPVPEAPFPRTNAPDEFHATVSHGAKPNGR
jgi:hypothetical protein